MDAPNAPLLPFGYGLSYTSFDYSDLKLSKKEINHSEGITATVTVTNTGNYDGEEVVQLYLRDVVRSITPPKRQLKGFQKIMLKKGESTEVNITLSPHDLKFYNAQLEFVSEAGEFEVFVGTNSDADLSRTFTLK